MAGQLQEADPRRLPEFLTQAALFLVPWLGLWAGTNVLFYKSGILNQDSRNHCVALVYSLWALVFASKTLFVEERALEGLNTASENSFLVFSLSFVLYDFAVCSVYGPMTVNSLAGYLFSAVGLFAVLQTGYGAPLLLYAVLIVESSSLLLHLRKMLGNMRKRHTFIYEIILLAYLVVFIVGRGIFGTIFSLYIVSHLKAAPKAFIIVSLLSLFESFTHFRALLSILKSSVNHRDERVQNGVNMWWWEVNPAIKQLDYYQALKQKNAKKRTKHA